MEPELEQRLQDTNKEHLILLLQELAARHPVLLPEMVGILEDFSELQSTLDDTDGDITEDWNFGGDEHGTVHAFPLPPNSEVQHVRIEEYTTRLSQENSLETMAETLTELLEEAEVRTEERDYYGTLDLYALLLDERLLERNVALTPIFDEAIDMATPAMEDVLCESSSNAMLDVATATLSPLLTASVRHRWLERLFTLWLKRLDTHRIEEDLPQIILNVAWSEDLLLLSSLAQNELQRQPHSEHSNIVDFAGQYRTKALEKFLKELPRP